MKSKQIAALAGPPSELPLDIRDQAAQLFRPGHLSEAAQAFVARRYVRTGSRRSTTPQQSALPLEKLHGTFVFFRGGAGLESAKVAALAGLGILLA